MSTYVLRLDRGEEIIESILNFCKNNKIKLGYFSGIGAVGKAELAHYIVENKKYTPKTFEKPLEILSLNGNITTMDGECYLHTHITLGDDKMNAFGGHLKSAIVSATCEIFIVAINSELGRKFDDGIGLNLLNIGKNAP